MKNYKRALNFYPIYIILVGMPFLIFSFIFFIISIVYKYPFYQVLLSFTPLLFFGLVITIVEFAVIRPIRNKLKALKEKYNPE